MFFAPKISKYFLVSLFETIHKSNLPNIFFEKFFTNFHLENVFSVILALTSNNGILLFFI